MFVVEHSIPCEAKATGVSRFVEARLKHRYWFTALDADAITH